MSAIKLTEQELKAIEDIKLRKKAIKEEIADIGLSKIKLKIRKEKLEEFYTKTLTNETQIAKGLEEKYGKGSVNIQSGTFTPIT
jgi:hypothetical protein